MSRQKRILALLVGVLVLALAYAYWAAPRQTPVAPARPVKPAARAAAPATHQDAPSDPRRVRLDILERDGDAFVEPKRNIFLLGEGAGPVAEDVVVEESFGSRPPALFPPGFSPAALPNEFGARPGAAPVDSSRFAFVGFLEKAGRKTVFLSTDGEIYVVREGDRFGKGQEFEVEEIAGDKIIVRQVSGGFPITVPLVGRTPTAERTPGSADDRSPAGAPAPTVRPFTFRPPPVPLPPVEEPAAEEEVIIEEETYEEEGALDEDAGVESVVEEPEVEAPQ